MVIETGWYSVNAELAVTNDVNNGPYSSFQIFISKLRVNGTEYSFPLGSKGGILNNASAVPYFLETQHLFGMGGSQIIEKIFLV
jgi:hypothetical protein